MKVYKSIESVKAMQSIRESINSPNILDIIWTVDGHPVDIDLQTIEDFALTGLNNCDFITSEYYKRGIR